MLLNVMLSLVLRLATGDEEYSGSGSGVGTHDDEEGSAESRLDYSGSGSGVGTHDDEEGSAGSRLEYSGSGSGMGTDWEDEDYIERQQQFQGYGIPYQNSGMVEPTEIELSGDGPPDYFVEPDLSIDVNIEPIMEVWKEEGSAEYSGSGSGMGTDDEDEDYNYEDYERQQKFQGYGIPYPTPAEIKLADDDEIYIERRLGYGMAQPADEEYSGSGSGMGTDVIATVEQEEIVQQNCGGCTLDLLVNQTISDGDDTETIAMAEFLLQSQEIEQLKQALEKKDIQISNLRKIAGELENYLEDINQENADDIIEKDNIISEISEEELNQEARIEDLEGETSLMKCRQKKRKLEGKLLFRQELKDDYQQELLEKKDRNRGMKQFLDDNIALSNVNKLLFKVEQTENEMCELIQNKQIEEMRKMERIDPQEARIIYETKILQDEVERQRSILERQEQTISQFEAIEASQLSIMRQHQTKISQLHSQMNDLSKHEPLCLDYDYDYHDYDLDINQSYIEINNSIRASMNNSTGQDLDTQLTHLRDNLQDILSFLNKTLPLLSCPHQDSYSEIRNVSSVQAANLGQIVELLNPLLPQDRQLHLPAGNVLSYGLPQLPEDSLLMVSSVTMSCPPQTQLSTHGNTWDISCPDGECPQVEDWPECLQAPQCTGKYEFGVEYPHNDIRSCRANKKPTPSACQEFCKSVPGCVGWEWGYDGDNCCAKSKMQNRKSGKSGRVAGLVNACPPSGTSGSSSCVTSSMTSPSRPDINGNPSKANTKCVFPFTFNGKTYNDCAPGHVASNMPEDDLWCSTKVDLYGEHVSGQGEWGYCMQSCSEPEQKAVEHRGYCLSSDGYDQNTGTSYLSSGSKSNCYEKCIAIPKATGCEFSQSSGSCIYHTRDVARGSGSGQSTCWVFKSSGKLTLVGGSKPSEGNVFYMGQPVCDDEWTGTRGNDNADVVCRELGFSGAYSFTRESYFGSVPSSFSMDSVNCSGSESRLEECSYSTNEDCGESEGAGVMCIV